MLEAFKARPQQVEMASAIFGIVEEEGITFRGFATDPRDSDIVYAAGELSSWRWAGEPRTGREFDLVKGVVYKTTDGGEHWTDIWRGDNLARYVWIQGGGLVPTPVPTPDGHVGPTLTLGLDGGFPDRNTRDSGAPVMKGGELVLPPP